MRNTETFLVTVRGSIDTQQMVIVANDKNHAERLAYAAANVRGFVKGMTIQPAEVGRVISLPVQPIIPAYA